MNNKKSILTAMLFGMMTLTACQEKDVYDPDYGRESADQIAHNIVQSFDYALTTEVPVTMNYSRGGVLVEVYDADSTSMEVASSSVRPQKIYAAFTGSDGRATGRMVVPTKLIGKKVYAFSRSIGVKSKVEATLTTQGLVVNEAAATRAVSLGKEGIPAGIRNAIESALPEAHDNTAKLTETDINLRVKKDCTIDVTFVWGGAGENYWTGFWKDDTWSCQRGEAEPAWVDNDFRCNLYYFTYTDGHIPTAEEIEQQFINDDHLVVADANQGSSQNLMGTTVRLTIDGNTTIPAGTRIGWVVTHPHYRLVNKWNPEDEFAKNWRMPYIYSIAALNPDQTSQSIRYTYGNDEDRVIVYGIEDLSLTRGNWIWGEQWPDHEQHIATQTHAQEPYFNMACDRDYNDMMFVVKASPIDAIIDDETPKMPEVEEQFSSESYEGTLLFEDLYPQQGDYDMNDVVITYRLTKYFNQENKLQKLGYEFTPVWSGAEYHSSFSFMIDGWVSDPVHVIDDQLKYVNAYTATPTLKTFTGEISTGAIVGRDKDDLSWEAFNPFITVKQTGREVHLTKKQASPSANLDGLDEYQKAYVNQGNFPFAMNIPTRNYVVVSERTRIDHEYPQFVKWVQSQGTEATDWYLHKR